MFEPALTAVLDAGNVARFVARGDSMYPAIRDGMVLGGLSLGGYVELALNKRRRGLFRGLILMVTRAGADTPEAARGREALAARVEADGNADAVVAAMLPKLFCA